MQHHSNTHERKKHFPEYYHPPTTPYHIKKKDKDDSAKQLVCTLAHTHTHAQKLSNLPKIKIKKYTLSSAPRRSTTCSTKKTDKISKRSHRGLHFCLLRNFAVAHRHKQLFYHENMSEFSMYSYRRKLWRHFSVKRLTCSPLSSVILCIESIWSVTGHSQTSHTKQFWAAAVFDTALLQGWEEKIVRLLLFPPKIIRSNYIYHFLPVTQLSILHSHPSNLSNNLKLIMG